MRENLLKSNFFLKKKIKTNHVGINIYFYIAELWGFMQSHPNLYAGNSSSTRQNDQWRGKIQMDYTLLQGDAAHISRLVFPHCCLCGSNLISCPDPNSIFCLLFCCLYSLPNVKSYVTYRFILCLPTLHGNSMKIKLCPYYLLLSLSLEH